MESATAESLIQNLPRPDEIRQELAERLKQAAHLRSLLRLSERIEQAARNKEQPCAEPHRHEPPLDSSGCPVSVRSESQ